MFRELKRALTWDRDFDSGWRRHVEGLPSGSEHWTWSRRIQEKKAYWRERGKRDRMTAAGAVRTGLLEIIDGIYAETRDRSDMYDVFVGFAASLYNATGDDYREPHIPTADRLTERWKPFHQEYRRRCEEKKADLGRRADELTAHRFSRDDIEAAWGRLLSGDVPDDTRRIWKAAASPRKSGHSIAEAAGVTIRDFVFWMVVFRDHGWMIEQIVIDEHLYVNQEYFLKSHQSLDADMKVLLERLSA